MARLSFWPWTLTKPLLPSFSMNCSGSARVCLWYVHVVRKVTPSVYTRTFAALFGPFEAQTMLMASPSKLWAYSPFGRCNWKIGRGGSCSEVIMIFYRHSRESATSGCERTNNGFLRHPHRPSNTSSRVAEMIINPVGSKNRHQRHEHLTFSSREGMNWWSEPP